MFFFVIHRHQWLLWFWSPLPPQLLMTHAFRLYRVPTRIFLHDPRAIATLGRPLFVVQGPTVIHGTTQAARQAGKDAEQTGRAGQAHRAGRQAGMTLRSKYSAPYCEDPLVAQPSNPLPLAPEKSHTPEGLTDMTLLIVMAPTSDINEQRHFGSSQCTGSCNRTSPGRSQFSRVVA